MRPGWIFRTAAVTAVAAVVGLIAAACGDAGESIRPAARATTATTVAAQQTVSPPSTPATTAATATPEVQPVTTGEAPATGQDAPAAGAPGARPGGAGFLGGRFGGAGLADAVTAAVAEAAGKPAEEIQTLQESGVTLAEIIEAEGIDRAAVVDEAVDRILANFPGGRGGQAGGTGAAGAGAGGGGAAGGGFDPGAALRNAVDALIDGESPAPPEGARQFGGMAQAITTVVAERTGRDPAEVREARAGGQSFASLLFVAGQDVDAAIDAIVETIQTNAGAAERPEGAPALPVGEALREAVEAIMYATDDSEADLTPPAAPGT